MDNGIGSGRHYDSGDAEAGCGFMLIGVCIILGFVCGLMGPVVWTWLTNL